MFYFQEFGFFMSGVRLESGGDGLNQQYLTPTKVITENGSDVIIVGRGILSAKDRVASAIAYKESGFNAYMSTL